MGEEIKPEPVKLFIGMISGRRESLEEAVRMLTRTYGPADLQSGDFPWDHSRYYEKEMGPCLKRRFLFFKNLISPEDLVEIKLKTCGLETRWSEQSGNGFARVINLDPGYVDLPKIVLASTKDFSHRVYLGRGIFGEASLTFRDGGYTPLPYTYPEFLKPAYLDLFKKARGLLWKARENRTQDRPLEAPA